MRGHCFSDYSLDQGTFKKAKYKLRAKCSSSYSTLKISIASRILTTTGAEGRATPYFAFTKWLLYLLVRECQTEPDAKENLVLYCDKSNH